MRDALELADTRLISQLRALPEILHDLDFTAERIARTLDAPDVSEVLGNSARYALQTEDVADELVNSAAGVMIQLFVRNGFVAEEHYHQQMPAVLSDLAADIGLVSRQRGQVRARLSITPLFGKYFFSDRLFTVEPSGSLTFSTRDDIVMPPHSSSLHLLESLAVDDSFNALVDVGCGCGVLGLALASGYASTMLVDVSPRAVRFAQANAVMNDIAATAKAADVTRDRLLDVPAHVVFNAPTTIPYDSAVGEPGMMTAETALTSAVGQLSQGPGRGGRAQVFVVVEVPHEFASAEELIRNWLCSFEFSRLEVRALPHSPFRVSSEMIALGSVDPHCLLLRRSSDARALAHYLDSRGTREVVPLVASVWG
ncbi:methyltransferase domain-containing protein [Micromonospora sp. KC207]|uniref:methyltransferase n=1 Tax=Micromonospora sp. KC207 TaxID=2530377 RepID=UPI00104A4BEA|nr:methyltransferase [Micromonospora sp. KC207]TDC65130.1 methyltransferase domain-containing protein [Micromonospora sp. KC207]